MSGPSHMDHIKILHKGNKFVRNSCWVPSELPHYILTPSFFTEEAELKKGLAKTSFIQGLTRVGRLIRMAKLIDNTWAQFTH
jgi:hypothetical protein